MKGARTTTRRLSILADALDEGSAPGGLQGIVDRCVANTRFKEGYDPTTPITMLRSNPDLDELRVHMAEPRLSRTLTVSEAATFLTAALYAHAGVDDGLDGEAASEGRAAGRALRDRQRPKPQGVLHGLLVHLTASPAPGHAAQHRDEAGALIANLLRQGTTASTPLPRPIRRPETS